MSEQTSSTMSKGTRFLVGLASFVVVVAGLRAANSIVVPFLLALFIAIICTPALFWMQRRRVPDAIAILLILLGIVAVAVVLALFLGASLNSFVSELPVYQDRLSEKTAAGVRWFRGLGLAVSDPVFMDYFNPAKALAMVGGMLAGLSKALTNLLLILLTVCFILLEASGFQRKFESAVHDPEASLARLERMMQSVKKYLALKSLFSLLTGALIWLYLTLLGVDYPLLWGVLAFLLNYVPNIGSLIAAVPAVLLALIQSGALLAVWTALGYVGVNLVVGSLMEPRFMGRGLGMSTLVIFVSLVFWGWVLGPVGMLLSVPLTMILKIVLESQEETRWIAVLLGSAPSRASLEGAGAGGSEDGIR